LLKARKVRYETSEVGIHPNRPRRGASAGLLALALAAPQFVSIGPARAATDPARLRDELTQLLRRLTAASGAADAASARWMAARLGEIEARAAEDAARRAFETRVRQAYMAGPGRAIDFLISASDFGEFIARLPYASSSLALGTIDATELTAKRRAVERVLADAADAQRSFSAAETRLGRLRSAIEQRLADAARATDDAGLLAEVDYERKRYAGTVDRVAGATRTIRRRRGEAMYEAAAPFLGPRTGCSIPKGLRSTGDQIAGGASSYGNEFRGQPTASGAWFVPERFTVAHRTLPFGLFLLISFRGRCVVSFLNDRGPYVDGRILDLSTHSSAVIGLTGVHDASATLLVRAR
jgi:Lytic transglycolase